MNLRQIDLNLLVVFNQLLIERRVSATAETLGLSQPAVSNALARLRKTFGDELFLRTLRGMVPTPLVEQLAEPVASALGLLHGALNQREQFEPASSTRAHGGGLWGGWRTYVVDAQASSFLFVPSRVAHS